MEGFQYILQLDYYFKKKLFIEEAILLSFTDQCFTTYYKMYQIMCSGNGVICCDEPTENDHLTTPPQIYGAL